MNSKVSCILATRDRRLFIPQALRCFRAQTYPDLELIVIDDGCDSVVDLCTGDRRINYIRLNQPTLLASKLNTGIRQASGTIIQKLDDDDYYDPSFVETAVHHLVQVPHGRNIVAWCCFLVFIVGDGCLRHSGHGWFADTSFCFHRKMWEACPFREVPRWIGRLFVADNNPTITRVCQPELLVVVRHGAHTWNTMATGMAVEDYMRRSSPYPKGLADIVSAEALSFYMSITRRGSR